MAMRYAVIFCPSCKKAKIAETHKKSTICVHCNKKLVIKDLKIQFETNSQQEARNIIGIIHAHLDGKQDEFIELIKKS